MEETKTEPISVVESSICYLVHKYSCSHIALQYFRGKQVFTRYDNTVGSSYGGRKDSCTA